MKTFRINYDMKLSIHWVINNIDTLWRLKLFFKLIENTNLSEDNEFEIVKIVNNAYTTKIHNDILNIDLYFDIPIKYLKGTTK